MDWKEEYKNALLDITDNPPDIRKIIKPHIPLKLYKYGSFQSNYWKDVIYKANIHLSSANIFNDPFDCKANFDYQKVINKGKFRKRLLKMFPEDELKSIPKEIIQKDVIEGMRQDVYVFCFSEVWNSILMWAHYANNYNGFCIEYDTSKIRDHILYNLYPVLYEKVYFDITDNLIDYNKNTGMICNLAKAQDWSYEKEWRIVEYSDHPIYVRKALKAIHLGKNCPQIIRDEIFQWARENSKEVYSIYPSNTQYKLERNREI